MFKFLWILVKSTFYVALAAAGLGAIWLLASWPLLVWPNSVWPMGAWIGSLVVLGVATIWYGVEQNDWFSEEK